MTTEKRELAIEVIKEAYEFGGDRDKVYTSINNLIDEITEPDSVDRAELKMVNSTYKLKRLLDENDKILKALKN